MVFDRAPEGESADTFNDRPGPQRSRRRNTGAGIVIAGVVFVGVFVLILGALVMYHRHEKTGGGEAESVTVESTEETPVPRHEVFGYQKVDADTPFRLHGTRIFLSDRDEEKTTLTLRGELENDGSVALDGASLEASLGLDEGSVIALEGGILKTVSRKKPWAPNAKREFSFSAKELTLESLKADNDHRFIWLTITAKNGKAFSYEGTIGEVDVRP
jgi:hypothetical protein